MNARSFVMVLIGPAGAKAVEPRATATACKVLGARRDPVWLAADEACEIAFEQASGVDALIARDIVRAKLDGLPIDIAVLRAEGRRKKLLVADMESTIIEQECLDELADYAGARERISLITERAMRGDIDFEAAIDERVSLLAGLDAALLETLYTERVTLMPGAATLVRTMKAHGAITALVSGGFTYFTARIARRLGFDEHQANTLDILDGKIAGTVARPILGREAKLAALERLAAAHSLAPADAMAIGDGANDLAMLKAAGLGIAYRAKPVVEEQAQVSIRHGDLTAALFLQGYGRADFVG